MSWRRTFATAAAVAAALSTAPAAHAADEPGAFSARPSPAAPQDKAGTFFRLHVERGTDRRQSVLIENLSKQNKHLLVSAVDGLTGTTSGSVYANRDVPRKAAGSWITIPVKSIDLPAGKSARVPFALSIPKTARTGDHLAGIAIQDARRTHSGSQMAITQIIRVVVGVHIIVDGPRQEALSLGKVSMKALPGTKVPSVVIHVENTGTKLCKPLLEVTLNGASNKQQLVSRQLDTVLPGTAIDYPMPWPTALNAGSYEVGVQAKQCGDPQAVQESADLGTTLVGTPDNPEPPQPKVIVQQVAIPWLGIAALLAAVAVLSAGAMAFLLRRRKRPA